MAVSRVRTPLAERVCRPAAASKATGAGLSTKPTRSSRSAAKRRKLTVPDLMRQRPQIRHPECVGTFGRISRRAGQYMPAIRTSADLRQQPGQETLLDAHGADASGQQAAGVGQLNGDRLAIAFDAIAILRPVQPATSTIFDCQP